MPRIDLEQDLGEIGQECNFQLLKHFSKLDILPWNAPTLTPGSTSGIVQFLRYDPLTTSFRTLPEAPRRFQGAVKVGLLTSHQAHLLSVRLLDFCRRILARYDGYYSTELGGKIARMVRRAADLQDMRLLEIDRDFLPDDLYSAMPWACKLEYFTSGSVKRVPVPENLISASRQPFTALGIGIDAVCSGPSAGLTMADIVGVLDLLEGNLGNISALTYKSDTRIKMVIPSIVGGFQGVTIANFVNLSDAAHYRVLSHLHQFGETIGHKCEEIRQHWAEQLLHKYDSLEEVAKAFLTILPPVTFILAIKGRNAFGLELAHEQGYWAGYMPMLKERLAEVQAKKEFDSYLAKINGDAFRIEVQLLGDLPSLDPVLTRLRMTASMTRITSSLDQASRRPVIRRSELLSVYESLERQIVDGVKVQSACKVLYVVEAILKNYDEGEARIHNASARAFITKRLGRPAVAYQVAGKSSEKLTKEISRLIPGIQFEAPTSAVLRARWRPVNTQQLSTERNQTANVD